MLNANATSEHDACERYGPLLRKASPTLEIVRDGQPASAAANKDGLSVRLLESSLETAPNGARFTLYHFEVLKLDEEGAGAAEGDDGDESGSPALHAPHAIARRFSEFVALDGTLRRSMTPKALHRLPSLPSSLTLNKLAWWVTAARKEALRFYLQELMAAPELRRRPEVRAFVQLGDADE